jgi:hypothetical protein
MDSASWPAQWWTVTVWLISWSWSWTLVLHSVSLDIESISVILILLEYKIPFLNLHWSTRVSQTHTIFHCLCLWIWKRCADVLLSSSTRCFLDACEVGFVFLIVILLYWTICVREILRECFCKSAVSVSGDCDWSFTPTRVKQRIRVMVLSDDVSNDASIDDGTGWDGDYVEPRECDVGCAEDAKSDDDCSNEDEAANSYLHWKGQDEVRHVKMCYTHRCWWLNIPTNLPGVIDQAKEVLRKAELFQYRWNFRQHF